MTHKRKDRKLMAGLPGACIRETYEALQPILQKYLAMKKRHMSRDRIIGLMHEAFTEATKRQPGSIRGRHVTGAKMTEESKT